MKIALIDTGVLKSEIKHRCDVRHFSVSNSTLVEIYKESGNIHGTLCFKEIINAIQLSIISVVFWHREPLFFMPKNFKNITKNS